MDMPVFLQTLDSAAPFTLRRVVERLRDGLFDPLGVQLLTAHEANLKQAFNNGVNALSRRRPAHLCICGAYGQGKSHSLTYLRQQALRQGFVTSQINLDPREIPFHHFRQVYQALMAEIRLPGTENISFIHQWKNRTTQLKSQDANFSMANLLPEDMPHLFKAVLAALAGETMRLSKREKALKKHAAFRPREFPYLLARALAGETVPVPRLRQEFKYRQVDFYKDASLVCKGSKPYLEMVFALSRLFPEMGFKGWVVLFDEGEAIVQTRITSRAKSYQLLHRMLVPDMPVAGFYPVFAFTDDFFTQVQTEDYDRIHVRKEVEIPYFDQNYAAAWKNLNIYRLHDLTQNEWKDLCRKLMVLHGRAYGWQPPKTRTQNKLTGCLPHMRDQETRLKLKALVEQLDIIHQAHIPAKP